MSVGSEANSIFCCDLMKQRLLGFLKSDHADVQMIGAVVGILITLIVAALVFYTVAGNIDNASIDSSFGGVNETPSLNATNDVLEVSGTFFSIAPITAIVVVAVVILGYVSRIGG